MKSPIKLLTLNTWKCDGQYPRRLNALRQDKTFQAADIVCLQEVFRSDVEGLDTLQHLASVVGQRHVMFRTARLKTRQIGNKSIYGASGLAVISRFPVLSHGVFCLRPVEGDMQRIAQWCVLDINSTRVLVVNVHLSHISTPPGVQQGQLAQVRRFANTLRHSLMIIAGDMNSPPDDLDVTGCQSAFDHPPPSTLNVDGDVCLDHVYACAEQFSISFENTDLLYDQETENGWVSDHKGVGVELVLK